MSSKLSRRRFLKSSLAATCAVAASSIPKPALANESETHLATLIDVSKCIACGTCVQACREVNEGSFPNPKKPFPQMFPKRVPVEDFSDKQDIEDRLTPYNWLFIHEVTVDVNGEEQTINIPRRCMHCVNPPCVKLCPWGAAKQEKNGLSKIDADICLGGSKCKAVCPWDIPQRQTGVGLYLDLLPSLAGNGVMYKCDRCYKRLKKGDVPACIEECPEEVQTIGPRAEIIKQAHTLANKINGYIYGETENGGTNTIYVSPIPFEDINKAISVEKGVPHLSPVKDRMADANNLVKAMAIAPVAGLIAAVSKHYVKLKND